VRVGGRLAVWVVVCVLVFRFLVSFFDVAGIFLAFFFAGVCLCLFVVCLECFWVVGGVFFVVVACVVLLFYLLLVSGVFFFCGCCVGFGSCWFFVLCGVFTVVGGGLSGWLSCVLFVCLALGFVVF